MVWGIFPGTYKDVSWESHMLGFFSGVVLSIWYKNEGPQRPVIQWEEEEETETERKGDGGKDCFVASLLAMTVLFRSNR
jgi:hypothetical protein